MRKGGGESIGEARAFLKRRGNPRGPRLEASRFLGARLNRPRCRALVPSGTLRACFSLHDPREYVFAVQLASEQYGEHQQAMLLAYVRVGQRQAGRNRLAGSRDEDRAPIFHQGSPTSRSLADAQASVLNAPAAVAQHARCRDPNPTGPQCLIALSSVRQTSMCPQT